MASAALPLRGLQTIAMTIRPQAARVMPDASDFSGTLKLCVTPRIMSEMWGGETGCHCGVQILITDPARVGTHPF